MVLRLYIQFSEDGDHIERWDTAPFDGGKEYISGDEFAHIPRLYLDRPASEQGFDVE